MNVIDCEEVFFAFDEENVLENVTFSVKAGELIGIIGPNGGGKTTLLQLLMGFIKPSKGKISLFGEPVEKKRSRIGYVPQNTIFDKNFPISVKELVLSPFVKEGGWFGKYSAKAKEKAAQALQLLGLEDHVNKPFGSLSGGLAQRALIARALVDDPDILLLDEPTASVDPQAREKIYETIYSFKGEKTILMVTHDLNTVIENVKNVYLVEKTVSSVLPQNVCEHFALGLYHVPLSEKRDA